MPSRRDLIRMTDEERMAFLRAEKTITIVSNGNDGHPHAMPMWFTVDDDGTVRMSTFRKSQKVKNIQRDPKVTLLVEAGEEYAERDEPPHLHSTIGIASERCRNRPEKHCRQRQYRAEEDRERYAPRAKERSDHHHHLDVSPAHRLIDTSLLESTRGDFSDHPGSGHADEPQDAVAEHGTNPCGQPIDPPRKEGHGQPDHSASEGKFVRDDVEARVRDRDSEDDREKNGTSERFP